MRSFTNFSHRKWLSKLLIGFIFIILFGINTFAEEEWYMVFTAGDSPKRAVFFMDMNSVRTLSGDVRGVTFVNVFEEKGSPQYTSSRLEYRCKSNEMRIAGGVNYTFDNNSVSFKETAWQKVNGFLFERVMKLTCNLDAFNKARFFATEGGKINNDKLNAQLQSTGLGAEPLLLMTSPLIPDFETILEILWSKFWKANRPVRTGTAKNTNKNQPPTAQTNQRAEELVKKGIELMKAGNYDQALANFTEAIRLSPNYAAPYFYRGYIFADVGEFDLAISNYTKSLELNPNDLSSAYNRGLIYFEQKHQFELAEADFTKAIQGDPQEPKYYVRRADLYESWGKDNLSDADRKKFNSLGGTALPGFQNIRRTLFPNAQFDANLAKNAIEPGTSTLIGRACAFVGGGIFGGSERFDAANVRVALFPVTPYFEKWYQLREKKEDKKTGVFINREAQKYAIWGQTNSKGEFVFSRLKPGKYFVQIIFNFTQVRTRPVYTGSGSSGNVTVDIYENRNFYYDRNTRLESFVEIKGEGESKKITVKNKKIALFGCKDLL